MLLPSLAVLMVLVVVLVVVVGTDTSKEQLFRRPVPMEIHSSIVMRQVPGILRAQWLAKRLWLLERRRSNNSLGNHCIHVKIT